MDVKPAVVAWLSSRINGPEAWHCPAATEIRPAVVQGKFRTTRVEGDAETVASCW